jgi:hypothetical protein
VSAYDFTIPCDRVASIRNDDIASSAAKPDRIESSIRHQNRVLAASREDDVGTARVIERTEGERPAVESAALPTGIADVDPIVTGPADEEVARAPARECVVAGTSGQAVSTAVTEDTVVAAPLVDPIVVSGSAQDVCLRRPSHTSSVCEVRARGAGDDEDRKAGKRAHTP